MSQTLPAIALPALVSLFLGLGLLHFVLWLRQRSAPNSGAIRAQGEPDLIRQERDFLRKVIDINPGLIFAKDREGRYTLANEALARLYGTTVAELIGKCDADFNARHDEVDRVRATDRQVMRSPARQFVLEETFTDAAGKVHWFQTVRIPLLNSDGTVDQILGAAIDISDRKQADLALSRQRHELAHLSRVMMLSELSGSLAHELNQPLAAILTNAQAALRFLDRPDLDLEEIRAILLDIVSDDHRAGEVIQGLRLLLRKSEMPREPLDPNAQVASAIKLLRSDMLNAGVAFSTRCAPDLPNVSGIAVQLQQVLLNLMVNGCDAMSSTPPPQRRLVVTIEYLPEGSVMFCVSDQGHGLPSCDEQRVFEPFFTTKPRGLGLGLAVCRNLIDAHGGRIWAARNIDRGATFCFTVPRHGERPT